MSIDLRSDTVTKPTSEMLRVMMNAEVGDDVFGEDPTVNALEDKVAECFGMEAGLFVPSGTMGNQLCIKVLTRPGDEVMIEEKGHIFNYEGSAAAIFSSVQLHTVKGQRGKLSADLLRDRPRGQFDWEPRTRVISLENSTNKGGGACYTRKELNALRKFADEHDLRIHLDGARLWNAVIATGIDPAFFGRVADTINVCFSKGLGAPVGSMILSSKEHIRRARRFRKAMGGGMRQVGILAAVANYAMDHHWNKLEEDHRRAKELASTINTCGGLSIDPDSVETNIVIFDLLEEKAETALQKLGQHGVQMVPFGPQTVRATLHHQVTDDDVANVQQVLKQLFD